MTTTTQSTDLKAAILSVLKGHEGAENSITAVEIGRLVGLGTLRNTWVVRERINELVHTDKEVICANDKGYWMSDKYVEVKECHDDLRNRGLKVLEHASDLLEAFNQKEQAKLL